MRRLIEDSLALDRSGSTPSERFDMAGPVEAMVEQCRVLQQTVCLIEAAPAVIVSSPLGMRRLVQNLIDNALRYGGGAELSVTASNRDYGSGFSAAMLAHGCQPFARGEASRNRATGGSGLGLAIASGSAEQHDGSVALHNSAAGVLSCARGFDLFLSSRYIRHRSARSIGPILSFAAIALTEAFDRRRSRTQQTAGLA